MCDKCADLDAMIAHYRKLADNTVDTMTRITIEMLLDDLHQDKLQNHQPLATQTHIRSSEVP